MNKFNIFQYYSHVFCESSMNSCIVDHFTGFYCVKYQLKWWLDSAWLAAPRDTFSGNARKPKVVSGDDLVIVLHFVRWWCNGLSFLPIANPCQVRLAWKPNRNTVLATQQVPTCNVGLDVRVVHHSETTELPINRSNLGIALGCAELGALDIVCPTKSWSQKGDW